MIFKHLQWKDYLIITSVFFVTTASISLITTDKTPYEATAPYFISLLTILGYILMMPINLPLVSFIHAINFFGHCKLLDDVNLACLDKSLIIPYDLYFTILPWICAAVYSLITAIFLDGYNSKRR
jgi:hypothetical protein